jgi:hypothetical protein
MCRYYENGTFQGWKARQATKGQKKGHFYYINPVTNVTQWTSPEVLETA